MIIITLISPQDCKNCIETKEQLAALQKEYSDVQVQHIDAWSPEGEALIMEHGIMASPGILVNGALLAAGPVSESRLRQAIEEKEGN
jgi:predicted thioredoxin/glutaredoxin